MWINWYHQSSSFFRFELQYIEELIESKASVEYLNVVLLQRIMMSTAIALGNYDLQKFIVTIIVIIIQSNLTSLKVGYLYNSNIKPRIYL
jgi:hypothetical protein